MSDLSEIGYEAATSATVDLNGNATARLINRGPNTFVVNQVSIEMPNAPSGAVANLRKDGVLITLMVANADVADGDPPVVLRQGETLNVEWSSCTPGDVGTAWFSYNQRR